MIFATYRNDNPLPQSSDTIQILCRLPFSFITCTWYQIIKGTCGKGLPIIDFSPIKISIPCFHYLFLLFSSCVKLFIGNFTLIRTTFISSPTVSDNFNITEINFQKTF